MVSTLNVSIFFVNTMVCTVSFASLERDCELCANDAEGGLIKAVRFQSK